MSRLNQVNHIYIVELSYEKLRQEVFHKNYSLFFWVENRPFPVVHEAKFPGMCYQSPKVNCLSNHRV